jgi:hypothetical protein
MTYVPETPECVGPAERTASQPSSSGTATATPRKPRSAEDVAKTREGAVFKYVIYSSEDFKFWPIEFQFLPDLNPDSMALDWSNQFRSNTHAANFGFLEQVVRYFAKVQAGKFN